ncbi:MAG: phosphotriesterase-related protein [Firmicutes bacterium]|nr:phosphotriesterase-related protein [Bacillota bacterium]
MAIIQTVLGPVDVNDLGVTDYHEHLYVDAPKWWLAHSGDFKIDDIEKNAQELRGWQATGGKTVIEMTAIDYGRNVRALRSLAEAVPGVNIIATTGFNRPLYCERWVEGWTEERLGDLLAREIEVGIDDTGIRAGVIKAGTEYNVLRGIGEKLLRVAAQAHKKTGAPIITHTTDGTMGLEQMELLVSEGVNPSHICIGHMDRNPDLFVHKSICQAGAYVGYDCPGKVKYGPDSQRIEVLMKLTEAGLGDRILLGNDMARRSYFRSYGGGPGLDFLFTRFVPRLRAEGLGQEAIDNILVNNPRRFLSAGR